MAGLAASGYGGGACCRVRRRGVGLTGMVAYRGRGGRGCASGVAVKLLRI